jgi:hypothetical protein
LAAQGCDNDRVVRNEALLGNGNIVVQPAAITVAKNLDAQTRTARALEELADGLAKLASGEGK